jgi:hypothetical protein
MPKITRIKFRIDRNGEPKYDIYIDYKYCVSVRARIKKAIEMHIGKPLKVGVKIDCDKLRDIEKYFWKIHYGKKYWEKEKIRIQRVKELIESFDNRIEVEVRGFGADTTEFIKKHPQEQGKPDLEVRLKRGGRTLLWVEVSGTDRKRGYDYWVRWDKIKYIQEHPYMDIWVALHYSKPKEEIVFIKPIIGKKYARKKMVIRDAIEYYVTFNRDDEEVKDVEYFREYLKRKINVVEKE